MNRVSLLILSCLISTTCAAQAYIPVGKLTQAKGSGIHKTLYGSVPPMPPPQCRQTDIPTPGTLKTKKFDTHMQIMTASKAASLNIIVFGNTSVSGNSDQLLAVSDSSRVAPCLSADGKTIMYYGQTIRTIVAMNDYTVKGSASFAVVAATATAQGKTNSVDLYEIGFGDTQLDVKLVAAKQTLGGSGINIENYSDFIKAYSAAETYAQSIQNPGIDLIAYGLPPTPAEYADMLASAWAIDNIAQGNGCQTAIKNFRDKSQPYQDAINDVYNQIAGGCTVNQIGKASAQQLLNGLKVRY